MPGRRNDSSLYAGGGSAAPSVQHNDAVDKLNAERVARKQAKEAEQRVISDAAPIFQKLIQEETDKTLLQILGMVGPSTDEKLLKETLAALNLYKTSMASLKVKLQNKLRDPNLKSISKKHDDDDGE